MQVVFEKLARKIYKVTLHIPASASIILLGLYLRYYSNNYVDNDLKKYRSNIQKLIGGSNVERYRITGTGVLHLECENYLIYYPLGALSEKTLNKQYSAWASLVRTNLKSCVVPRFNRKSFGDDCFYITTKLNKCDNYKRAREILILLAKHGAKDKISKSIYNGWISSLGSINEEVCFWQKRANHICKQSWQIGPCHCDYHIDNVMSLNGKAIMIDLDRFNWKAPQVLDWVHFNVISDCKTNNINWLQWLEIKLNRNITEIFCHMHMPDRIIKNNDKYDILDMYFLSRLTWDLRGRDSFRYKKTLRDIEEYSIKRILHSKD